MATHDIFMPALSSTMTEGKVVEWLKKPGDKVSRGESVLVVESDKADMDVESFQDGFLAVVLMPAGSMAPVGETIGLIVETQEEISEAQANAPKQSKTSSDGNELKTPSADKNSASSSKPPKASDPIEEPQLKRKSSPSPIPVKANHSFVNQGRIVASPRAKKLASQMGVDLATVVGTGPHGRIQAEDVQTAKGEPISVPWVAESDSPAAFHAPSSVEIPTAAKNTAGAISDKSLEGKSFGSPGDTIPFNTLQQAVNRNMEASLAVPCFRVGYTITTEKLESFYRQIKPKGVTMTALLVKAVGKTLARHPQLNSAFSENGMAYAEQVNVAVAVAMEDGGLITPVLKNADTTNLFEMSRQWSDLVKRSRSKQLQPHEYSTGTFTLSNLGMFGVDRFDAILPPGTGAILAVAASRSNVVAGDDGAIAVKRQMQVNLTADHRVVYGADGAAFLKDLANLLENQPETLAS